LARQHPRTVQQSAVGGSFASTTLGSLNSRLSQLHHQPGGSSSPFTVTAPTRFRARRPTATAPIVTTFKATGASFNWTGVYLANVPTSPPPATASSRQPHPGHLSLGGLTFNMGAVNIQADAAGLNLKLHFGGASLSIPNVATGNKRFRSRPSM